ncbi:hypothetical protein RvY_14360 [Ramazzottius varieornatus]|uniref:Ribosome biogenesis regulatory protein n=1 Tax=Ramazzottius varieornatus TaxID=947166 RepID=A0A1D1VR24_RAMVA|nr:hypothetical protein RvY_14360 [Ramazzottius varieornatus]
MVETTTKAKHGLEFDIGNLLVSDPRPLVAENNQSMDDLVLKEMTELTQLLLGQVWALPLERTEDVIVAALPKPTTFLPREKPIPKPKALTKWERYAKEKGITKQKKSRMVYDPTTKEYKPRWGYQKPSTDDDDWVREVNNPIDEQEDVFEQKTKAKKERVAKNELQRLRNIARAYKTKVPARGILPVAGNKTPSKSQISQSAAFAKTADASVGKFTETLKSEKPVKNMGKKRKFESNEGDLQSEKMRTMGVLNSVFSKKPKVDTERALGRVKRRSDRPKKPQRSEDQKERKGGLGNKFGPQGKAGKGRKGPANNKMKKPAKSPRRF